MAASCHDNGREDLFGRRAERQDGQAHDALADIQRETDNDDEPDEKVRQASHLTRQGEEEEEKNALVNRRLNDGHNDDDDDRKEETGPFCSLSRYQTCLFPRIPYPNG